MGDIIFFFFVIFSSFRNQGFLGSVPPPQDCKQRAKSSENFAEEKMFAEDRSDISEDCSEDRRYHF